MTSQRRYTPAGAVEDLAREYAIPHLWVSVDAHAIVMDWVLAQTDHVVTPDDFRRAARACRIRRRWVYRRFMLAFRALTRAKTIEDAERLAQRVAAYRHRAKVLRVAADLLNPWGEVFSE